MTDFMLRLSKNDTARRLVASLGLPLPLPPVLSRTSEPVGDLPLKGLAVALAPGNGPLHASLEAALTGLGAVRGGETSALVFDATALKAPEELERVYSYFHERIGTLPRCGRVVVLTKPAPTEGDSSRAATQRALEGFIRSLAKEVGRRGVTANLVRVGDRGEPRIEGALGFLLSPKSAFITGQVLDIDGRTPTVAPTGWAMALQKKVALVTGAANGIGRATAKVLSREGAQVICVDRPQEEEALVRLCSELPNARPVLCDVSSKPSAQALADSVAHLDIVVHSAGITRDKTLAKMAVEQWQQVIDVNLAAVLRIHQALEPKLGQGAHVTVLSSVAGLAGNMGQTAYAATKAALVSWVWSEAERLLPRGIVVNAVAPGFIETRMTATIPLFVREAGRRLSALGQGGMPEDVAEALLFLSSPASWGINGRTLRVCGGAFLGA